MHSIAKDAMKWINVKIAEKSCVVDVGRFVVASFADVDCAGIVPQLVEDVELYFAQEMPNLLWNVIPVKCRTASYVWQVVQKIHVSGVAIELVRE
jgi:REP element-mobilizing transposase RayT